MTPAQEPASTTEATSADPASATQGGQAGDQHGHTPTAAQLRRFIKSRPYVPLHELRRRFELNGELEEVTAVDGPEGMTVYVGLPEREARVLADLARDGDIGLELSRDPRVPIVIGVYPIRPVSRS